MQYCTTQIMSRVGMWITSELPVIQMQHVFALDLLCDREYPGFSPDIKIVRHFVLQMDRLPPPGARRFSFGGEMNWMAILFTAGGAAMLSASQTKLRGSKMTTEQVVREGLFELDASGDRALPFFTPEGERAWVKGWDPKPVYPRQATVVFQVNSVFRVDQDEERSLWTIVEADSREHVAEYIYVVEGERLSRVRVQIEPLSERHCRVHVRYVHTATSEKGLYFVASVTEESYAQKMRDWQRMVSAAIR